MEVEGAIWENHLLAGSGQTEDERGYGEREENRQGNQEVSPVGGPGNLGGNAGDQLYWESKSEEG